jgi:tetratricopeptide (TPR) repeat protein
MHHYCDGLRFYNRAVANTFNRTEFKYNIERSLSGFDYVLSHTSSDFNMRPEVIANKARTLALAGRAAEALMLYTGVVQQTPTYVPAYLYLADYYATSDRKKALSLVSDGLRHNPGTKSLQRRYQELGGELPYPEPPKQVEPAVAEMPPIVEQPAAPDVLPDAGLNEKNVTEPESDKPQIGSPTNPYCRFCPD